MANEFEDNKETADELTLLKDRADIMGIKYHPAIGLDTLKERIKAQLTLKNPSEMPVGQPTVNSEMKAAPVKTYTKAELISLQRTVLRKKCLRLIRIKVSCMNPNKKAWPGEIFDIGNSVIGSVKKFVPFDVDAGYHVPYIIYEHIKNRKYQKFSEIKLPNGRKMMKGSMVKEFSIDVMDPLTSAQLKELADRQILNHSIDNI